MEMVSKETVDEVKRYYPVGARVELVYMDDKQAPPVGTRGTVTGVDDCASVLVEWDNGSTLNVVWSVDLIKNVDTGAIYATCNQLQDRVRDLRIKMEEAFAELCFVAVHDKNVKEAVRRCKKMYDELQYTQGEYTRVYQRENGYI